MTWNISDLLDHYPEDSLMEEEATPLSLERIQRRTMEAAAPQKRRRPRRLAARLLIAAIVVSMLAVTALAGERSLSVGDWFRDALNQKARENAEFAQTWELQGVWKDTISESQLAALNAHGQIVNKTVTDNGTSITLMALYGDEYVLNLFFRVAAPEGTQLPDGLDYFFANGVHLTASGTPQGIVLVPEGYVLSENYRPTLKALPDPDPTDNRKDFLLSLHHRPFQQSRNGVPAKSWAFHDSVPKSFAIAGLFYEVSSSHFEPIALGDFSFDITNSHTVDRLDVDVSECAYSGSVSLGAGSSSYSYTVAPVSLSLSPFSAEMENRFTCTEEDRCIGMDLRIVLKDGTTEGIWQRVSIESEPGYCRTVMAFTNPVDLAQIDHIVIGDPNFGDTLHTLYP